MCLHGIVMSLGEGHCSCLLDLPVILDGKCGPHCSTGNMIERPAENSSWENGAIAKEGGGGGVIYIYFISGMRRTIIQLNWD